MEMCADFSNMWDKRVLSEFRSRVRTNFTTSKVYSETLLPGNYGLQSHQKAFSDLSSVGFPRHLFSGKNAITVTVTIAFFTTERTLVIADNRCHEKSESYRTNSTTPSPLEP